MRIVLITGDHNRHKYLASQVLDSQHEVHWIIESREEILPAKRTEISTYLAKLADLHFQGRLEAESLYFGNIGYSLEKERFSSHLTVSRENLNSETTARYIKGVSPHLILSYGCHKLSEAITSLAEWKALNIHGGLSPKYKGTATHFWPTYFLEPHLTGLTLHSTSQEIDSGEIYLQTSVLVNPKNGVHENACQAVLDFGSELRSALSHFGHASELPVGVVQRGAPRTFRASDWSPHHLKLVYETFENKVNAYCLENNLCHTTPILVNVFH